jgi:type II secretory pathway pseudopilin PulG
MKINENGRSMIEMLGVLAIIGVLSVGGIAGYSKAMAKFRVNKSIDQISHIVANTRILFGSQNDYSGLGTGGSDNTFKIVHSAKLFPEEMYLGNGTTHTINDYKNPFAFKVNIETADRYTSGDNKAFLITYEGIPMEACMDLATQDWGASSGSGMVAVSVNNKGNATGKYLNDCAPADGLACAGKGPMTVAHAVAGCNSDNNNILYLKFY